LNPLVKKIIPFIIILFVTGLVLSTLYLLGYWQENPGAEMKTDFSLHNVGLEEEPEPLLIEVDSNVKEKNINISELRRLKRDLIKIDQEDSSGNGGTAANVDLDDYDLPESIFMTCNESPGFMETVSNMNTHVLPAVNEHDYRSGKIINTATVCSSNLKTLLSSGGNYEKRTYINIVEYRSYLLRADDYENDAGRSSVFFQIKNEDTFTVAYYPEEGLLRLVEQDRGLQVEHLTVGSLFETKDFVTI